MQPHRFETIISELKALEDAIAVINARPLVIEQQAEEPKTASVIVTKKRQRAGNTKPRRNP